jgi:hypothetical protein
MESVLMIKFDSKIYQNKAKAISAKLQELYWKVQLAFLSWYFLVLFGRDLFCFLVGTF